MPDWLMNLLTAPMRSPSMRDAWMRVNPVSQEGEWTKETQSTTVSATASQADVTDVVPATEGEKRQRGAAGRERADHRSGCGRKQPHYGDPQL
ncbi:enterobacteria phage lambda, capsid assembly protein [Escherichia coli]|nr:enterobacteria phage lambda, capsid assembly protein [Escherichia coli]